MIILDTNVFSEMMRESPAPNVVFWLRQQRADSIFITAITVAEILAGIALLPEGRRRSDLANGAWRMFNEEFVRRTLPFERTAAEAYASILAGRARIGKPMPELDAQIAAIASAHQMKVATRNVRDFVDCGIEIIDPWTV